MNDPQETLVSNDFYDLDKTLRELDLEEEELKRLVSEGEIRAFRDDEQMKFKAEDIDRFRRIRNTETLDDDIPDELEFDEDDADQEVGMATAAITDDSFLDDDDDGELELDDEPAPAARRSSSRGARSAAAAPAKPRRVTIDEPEETEGPVWTAGFVACTVFALFAVIAAADVIAGEKTGLSGWAADWVEDNMLDDVETQRLRDLAKDEDGVDENS